MLHYVNLTLYELGLTCLVWHVKSNVCWFEMFSFECLVDVSWFGVPRFESSGSGWRIEDKEDDLLSSPPIDISAATTKINIKLDSERFNHNV